MCDSVGLGGLLCFLVYCPIRPTGNASHLTVRSGRLSRSQYVSVLSCIFLCMHIPGINHGCTEHKYEPCGTENADARGGVIFPLTEITVLPRLSHSADPSDSWLPYSATGFNSGRGALDKHARQSHLLVLFLEEGFEKK